jgi:serine/threonine protein kinase
MRCISLASLGSSLIHSIPYLTGPGCPRRMRHPPISAKTSWLVRHLSAFQGAESVCLATEYVPGADFRALLFHSGVPKEEHACFYIAEMFASVNKVHGLVYIPQDLNPERVKCLTLLSKPRLFTSKAVVVQTPFACISCIPSPHPRLDMIIHPRSISLTLLFSSARSFPATLARHSVPPKPVGSSRFPAPAEAPSHPPLSLAPSVPHPCPTFDCECQFPI